MSHSCVWREITRKCFVDVVTPTATFNFRSDDLRICREENYYILMRFFLDRPCRMRLIFGDFGDVGECGGLYTLWSKILSHHKTYSESTRFLGSVRDVFDLRHFGAFCEVQVVGVQTGIHTPQVFY